MEKFIILAIIASLALIALMPQPTTSTSLGVLPMNSSYSCIAGMYTHDTSGTMIDSNGNGVTCL